MSFLIDTNICIYIMNQRPVEVIQKFKTMDVGQIGGSVITVSELQYGVSKSRYRKKNSERLEAFLIPFDILSYDEVDTKYYGEIRAKLEKEGQGIGTLDLLIAAHALSRDRVLVTNNDKEFRQIKALKVENWVR